MTIRVLGGFPFKFHYPARGRKLARGNPSTNNIIAFKFHYPARGRKHCAGNQKGYHNNGSNSITPQGDGNNVQRGVALQQQNQFKFHYPARGRKPSTPPRPFRVSLPGSNSITPQGDGNWQPGTGKLTHQQVQIPLPRKGTETLRRLTIVFA